MIVLNDFKKCSCFSLLLLTLALCGCASLIESSVETKQESMQAHRGHKIGSESLHQYTNSRTAIVWVGSKIEDVVFEKTGDTAVRFRIEGENVQDSNIGVANAISDDGYFLTAKHVVEGAEEVWLVLKNLKSKRFGKAEIVWFSDTIDLAIVKVDFDGMHYFDFADDLDSLKQNQDIFLIGNHGGHSYGTISKIKPTAGEQGETKIVHSAPLRRGDSGGALITPSGKLIGVNVEVALTLYNMRKDSFAVTCSPEILLSIISEHRKKVKQDRPFSD